MAVKFGSTTNTFGESEIMPKVIGTETHLGCNIYTEISTMLHSICTYV